MRSAKSGSEATKLEERGSDSVRTPFLHFMNTGIIRSEIYWGGGVLPGGTFRFKKIDGSFWNGETFRFADYTVPLGMYCRINLFVFSTAPFCHEEKESVK